MELTPGAKLGPYEILSRAGAGGMGEVWKARDSRLDRVVAIKVSQERFSDRFEREARAVAALNHPNICQLYDVGPDYLVMEYVEGAPVLIADSTRKLLDLAVQMSDGLAAAHAAGIIHRDLKPDNIMVTIEGRIKILDFGLAKAESAEIAPDDVTRSMGLRQGLTNPGTTVGTSAYMSPEQARGQANLTPQSDQFSLGLVLYELAAGRRAFQRGSAVETMSAIIRDDAEPLPATVPAPLRWIIERLLAKEPAERYDSTRDLYRELRQVRDRPPESASASAISGVSGVAPRAAVSRRQRLLARIGIAALALVIIAAGLVATMIRPAPSDFSAYKFTPVSRDEATEMFPSWSPDGKSIAYVANVRGVFQVFTRVVGSPDTAQLTHAQFSCGQPVWSPDGATIYYNSHAALWAVAASGGAPELIIDKASRPAIHPDGKTAVFERDDKTWVAPLKGGAPVEVSSVPRGVITQMQFSPDGTSLAFLASNELWVRPWPAGTPRDLGVVGFGASWLPDSRHLVISVGSGNNTLALVDATDGSRRIIYRSTDYAASPSVSFDGKKIAWSGGEIEWDVLEISLPDGRVHTMVGGGGNHMRPDWAPSGTHFLFSTSDAGTSMVLEDRSAAEGFSRRVAEAPPGSDDSVFSPRWAPDATRFLFTQGPSGRLQLTIANASGGRWTPLADVGTLADAHAWSPDGQWIAYLRREGGKQELVKMKPAAGATQTVLASSGLTIVDRAMVQWSPSGEWIAYPSLEGLLLVSAEGAAAGVTAVRKLSSRNLVAFAFSKDGGQIYGIVRNTTGQGAQWQLYSLDVKTGADKLLAPLDLPASTEDIAGFSMHPDGKRFLTSIAKWPFDIWMLEGWDQPRKTWLDRLLRR